MKCPGCSAEIDVSPTKNQPCPACGKELIFLQRISIRFLNSIILISLICLLKSLNVSAEIFFMVLFSTLLAWCLIPYRNWAYSRVKIKSGAGQFHLSDILQFVILMGLFVPIIAITFFNVDFEYMKGEVKFGPTFTGFILFAAVLVYVLAYLDAVGSIPISKTPKPS